MLQLFLQLCLLKKAQLLVKTHMNTTVNFETTHLQFSAFFQLLLELLKQFVLLSDVLLHPSSQRNHIIKSNSQDQKDSATRLK